MTDIQAKLSALLRSILPSFFQNVQQSAKYIQVENNQLHLSLPFVCNSLLGEQGKFRQQLEDFAKEQQLEFNLSYALPSIKGQDPKKVKNVIAVASGKGGVGKSTTALNLAEALQLEGAKVGILDADIYGPSLPTLLGTKNAQPQSPDNKNMNPIVVNEIQSMSIGYLVDADAATIWRGPMASRAFQQLYNETLWQELDYLIVDMPPGTGDIQLTLAQNLPVTAALIVTTPQDLALVDAIKGIAMFNKVEIEVLGIVENMSYHTCTKCGHKEHIFGDDGGKRIASKYQTEMLAQLPLDIQIREIGDSGGHLMFHQKAKRDIQKIYSDLACKVSFKLSQQKTDPQQISIETISRG
ncbi:iron-sulfur cluster carrier protein ApbC [Paraglaciecola aestuariivivens]